MSLSGSLRCETVESHDAATLLEEYSRLRRHSEEYKFTVETFTSLAADGGWSVSKTWLSEAPQVALFRLEPTQQRDNR
jgi:hypothetical protein